MDIEEELRKEQKEAKNALAAVSRLLESEGWKILSGVLERQIRVREIALVYGDDFEEDPNIVKGEARALKLVVQLPENIVAVALETLNPEEENNDE